MAEPLRTAAIRAEPDLYNMASARLVGRHSAGNGFLRAVVEGRAGGPVYGYTANMANAQHFADFVRALDPTAEIRRLNPQYPASLDQAGGVLYLGDAMLTPAARLRLRAGPAHYALCGVTHTTSTQVTLQQFSEYLTEPVMPWDALICTSAAAAATVANVLEAQGDYLAWRLGGRVNPAPLQIPVIPLGVHTADFAFSAPDRAAAREALGLTTDEVAALFVGRINPHAKAHPFAMFHGLQAAAERSGKKVVLVLAGRTSSEAIETMFTGGAAFFAPDVRVLLAGGEQDQIYSAYAGADLFISLSDGLQETFGLTPIEAMAAGLPVVVTDWDGYRDTVRDGVDGFRVSTWAPHSDEDRVADRLESETITYDTAHAAIASATSADLVQLAERLTALIESPDLRRRMGQAGQVRARQDYDWAVIYRRYQALWGEMNARRLAALADPSIIARLAAAPRATPSWPDLFQTFGHYPTARLTRDTRIRLALGATLETFRERQGQRLFRVAVISEAWAADVWATLAAGEHAVGDLPPFQTGSGTVSAVTVVSVLAKMGLVELRQP